MVQNVPKSTSPSSCKSLRALASKSLSDQETKKSAKPLKDIISKKTIQTQSTFSDKVQVFFDKAISVIKVVFGLSDFDDAPYQDLLGALRADSKLSIEDRANLLFNESNVVVNRGKDNLQRGKDLWGDISLASGVPMSQKQRFLAGGSEAQNLMQHYYNNCAINCLAGALKDGIEIRSFTDIDNTRVNKNLDPEDTARFQAQEVVFWGDRSLKIAPQLNIRETGLTARAAFDTPNIVIPEALDESYAYALLNGGVGELFGIGETEQLEGLERTGLSFLSGAGNHQPGELTKLDPSLIRSYYLQKYLDSEHSPRFGKNNDKTYSQRLAEIAKKYGCCYQEHKTVPAYLIDTFLETGAYDVGKVYLPHYKKIIQIKKECFQNGEKTGKSEQEIWSDFASIVKASACEGRINNEGLKYIILSDSYYALIDKGSLSYNPQAFYKKIREGTIDDTCTHYFNRHGTPVKEAMEESIKFHDEEVSSNHHIRRIVAELIHKIEDPNKNESDISKFVSRGIKIFKKEGVSNYLNWRLIHYFMDNYSTKKGKSNNPYNRPLIQNIKLSNGNNLFIIDERNKLKFNETFLANSIEAYERGGFQEYKKYVESEFKSAGIQEASDLLETFLPIESDLENIEEPKGINDINFKFDLKTVTGKEKLETLRNNELSVLKNITSFYPNQFHTINNKRTYDGKTVYTKARNIISKCDDLNELGQYYFEIQSCFDKGEVLLTPLKLLCKRKSENKNIAYHAAGDSKQDIGMLSRALESGGYCDVVFNQIRNGDIYADIISKRLAYTKEFKNKAKDFSESTRIEELNKLYEECCTVFGIYALDNKRINGEIKYLKITGFKLDKEKGITAVYEQDNKAGKDKLYNQSTIVNELDQKYGNKIVRNTCPEAYIRRRAEVLGLLTGKEIELNEKELIQARALFNKREKGIVLNEEEQTLLSRYERLIREDKEGFILPEESPIILNRLIDVIPKAEGLLANKTLLKLFGRKKVESFVKNLPNLFHNLLKYSGIIMLLGGGVRLLSAVSGGLKEPLYKTGYWMSNGLRAISALGGALRGELNVHKYHNIAFGEAINIVSSFLDNGLKHLGLGLGNFVLFLGRGQQAAQRQQRVNNHTREVLEGKIKPSEEINPQNFVRRITNLATGALLKVKEIATKEGISSFVSEIGGNIEGAYLSTIQFVKDLFKDPRLIFELKERRAEKSGSFYRSVPSAGHLMASVGALSGIGAAIAAIFGRSTKFGEVDESGFNRLGNLAVAFANAIAAPGIFFNGKEIMANPGGLPKLFRGLNGKDIKYNPLIAGIRQMISSIGFLLIPWGGLHNKYVASLFDMFNGVYFLGAAEEEIPNTTALGINILRKGGLYKDPAENYRVQDFSTAA